jgi:hypothetical protein
VLTVRQDVQGARVDSRTDDRWQVDSLNKASDVLALPLFGLRCVVGDLYRGTPFAA